MTDGANDTDYIELVAAMLLGVAAIAIAWSTYQSALWGGIQDEGYTESVREASNAVDQLQAADRIRALDQLIFVEIRSSGACEEPTGDQTTCDRLLESMSATGQVAVDQWSQGDPSPFESPAYVDELYQQGLAAQEISDEQFRKAGEANTNGDNHELAATVLTAVLFFAGIAAVMDDRRIGWALIVAAAVFLITGVGYSLSLPVA